MYRGSSLIPKLWIFPLERVTAGGGYGRGAFLAAVKRDREDPWSARKCECRHE